MGKKNKSGLIYSSEHGKMCPACSQPFTSCKCSEIASKKQNSPSSNCVEVRRETKARKGSGVVVIRNLPLSKSDTQSFAKHRKAKCGTGGTVKDCVVEIQGDNVELIMDEIQKQGWKVKKIGG